MPNSEVLLALLSFIIFSLTHFVRKTWQVGLMFALALGLLFFFFSTKNLLTSGPQLYFLVLALVQMLLGYQEDAKRLGLNIFFILPLAYFSFVSQNIFEWSMLTLFILTNLFVLQVEQSPRKMWENSRAFWAMTISLVLFGLFFFFSTESTSLQSFSIRTEQVYLIAFFFMFIYVALLPAIILQNRELEKSRFIIQLGFHTVLWAKALIILQQLFYELPQVQAELIQIFVTRTIIGALFVFALISFFNKRLAHFAQTFLFFILARSILLIFLDQTYETTLTILVFYCAPFLSFYYLSDERLTRAQNGIDWILTRIFLLSLMGAPLLVGQLSAEVVLTPLIKGGLNVTYWCLLVGHLLISLSAVRFLTAPRVQNPDETPQRTSFPHQLVMILCVIIGSYYIFHRNL